MAKWTNSEPIRWRLATPQKPGDVRLLRTLRCDDRKVLDYSDDEIQPAMPSAASPDRNVPTPGEPTSPVASSPEEEPAQQSADPFLLADLDLARDGLMRDIVETIQRDQLRLVADDRRGLLVIQGGPGTGKTAVGLHRVTWLLDNKRFTASEVLVVGPHRGFLKYVSQVLPRLDSHGVRTVDVAQLWEGDVRGVDSPKARLVKSDERMAQVLHRAVESQIRPETLREQPETDLRFTFKGATLAIALTELQRFADEARNASGPYLARRRRFVDLALDRLMLEYTTATRKQTVDKNFRSELEKQPRLANLINAVWPTMSAERALRQLLSDPDAVRTAASGILTLEEQDAVIRPQARRIADEPWTREDLVCLEELRHLLAGDEPQRYRHIVVDEAQDLTPMQARSLARRCPTGSMTVLGDLAQATGPRQYDVWGRLAEILAGEDGWYIAELTTGYRVPAEVMEFAAPLAAAVSPSTAFPVSVRPAAEGTLTVVPVDRDKLVSEAASRALALTDPDEEQLRSVAVIVPDDESLLGEVRQEVSAAQARTGLEAGRPVTVLSAPMAKGLEFDHVLVMEPGVIADHGAAGLRQLYVAITRCTQTLTVLHSAPLPAVLGQETDDHGPATVPADITPDAKHAEPEGAIAPPVLPQRYVTYEDFLSALAEDVRVDRASHVHEGLRHGLMSELHQAHPSESALVDIACDTRDRQLLYEVLGQDGVTYERMRGGAQRILDVEQTIGERADYLFLVLPEAPEDAWTIDLVERTYNVSVIWRTGTGWDGTDVDVALGRESSQHDDPSFPAGSPSR